MYDFRPIVVLDDARTREIIEFIKNENLTYLDDNLCYTEEYRGYSIAVMRHVDLGHLCGYIDLAEENINEKQYNLLDRLAHGGITHYINNEIGFDCGHCYDIMPYSCFNNLFCSGKYRDFNYVLNNLKEMVDALVESKGGQLQCG
ncbi:hypothetical protein [uncultured Staphylococcus sp.]|uniref:hypothetical protein n=1 Tax=uncultured Staphylococcus sp. TaxID=189668 RepID=UPI0025DB549B|nr:hypothetical protein [uncultured Staphylococcus sp.]